MFVSRLLLAGLLASSLSCSRAVFAPAEEPTPSLQDFLPAAPAPTGEPQAVFAGVLTEANLAQERVDGPAAQGLPGDIFLRNDKIRLVLQQPGRAIAVLPDGGNIVDADIVRSPQDPFFDLDNDPQNGVGNDQFGELSLLFRLGRSIRVTRAEIVADGSAGGPALVRFFGVDDIDDFIDVPAVVPLPLGDDVNPDIALGYDAAIDYILEPGSDTVQVRYTVFNGGDRDVATLAGILGDMGGVFESFVPTAGFESVSVNDALSDKAPIVGYSGIQTPGVGYGVIPFFVDPQSQEFQPQMKGVTVGISGALVMLYNTSTVADILGGDFSRIGFLVRAKQASTIGFDFVVGRDISLAETRFQELRNNAETIEVSGSVTSEGLPLADARIGVFASDDDILDPEEKPLSLLVTDENGQYRGALAAGSYLLVADVDGFRRPAPFRLNIQNTPISHNFLMPQPAKILYTIRDSATNEEIPSKIFVLGVDAQPQDKRFRDPKASVNAVQGGGIVATRYSRSGDSGLDPEGALRIEDGRYRIVVARGMEYSLHEEVVDLAPGETVTINALLSRVVNSTGYIKADFHQHAVNSPDAPVRLEDRAVSYACENTEFFASTDHDFRTDYEPLFEALGLTKYVDSVVGEETTTFAYGHFNSYPLPIDKSQPNNGALDWGRGASFLGLFPREIFAALRQQGARVVQLNHPRSTSGGLSGEFLDMSRLNYDFVNRSFGSDLESSTVNTILRLEEGLPIFDENFDAAELYNGFNVSDNNGDNVREEERVDLMLRDFFNFYSFGKFVTMVGVSDTHNLQDPVGAPGTFVRVSDDSEAAIENGFGLREAVFSALSGLSSSGNAVAKDVVVTNTPLLRVEVDGDSVIGHVTSSENGIVRLRIHAEAPEWALLDTVEIFANRTFENPAPGEPFDVGALVPDICFTTRENRQPSDTCDAAEGSARALVVSEEVRDVVTGAKAVVIDFEVEIDLDSLPNRGETGDTWIVVRVFGSEDSLFPVSPSLGSSIFDVIEQGVAAARGGHFPFAIANPVFVDRNGDGVFTAPFAP